MKRLLSMLLLCITCVILYAQDSNNELLKKLVEKNILTQSEADSLRTVPNVDKTEKPINNVAEKVRQAFNTPYMQFGGYGLFAYKYSDISEIKHSAQPRVVFISMRGELTKTLRYYILTEFVSPRVYEFYGEWAPSEQFNIKMGQLKSPLSLENQMSLTAIEGTQNTRSVSALIGMRDDVMWLQNGVNNTGRDIGIRASGGLFKTQTHNFVNYDIGIYQGTGLNTQENNNSKDLAVNLMFQPIKDFRIGGGAYLGEANYIKPSETRTDNHVRNRWIVSSDYRTERVYARAEWIKGNDGGIAKEGLHGMGLYYFLPKKLNAFAKVDYLNQDKDVSSEVVDYMLGVNYYFYGSCRLQLNYVYSDYSKSWDAPNSNIVTGQLQIVF
ncbi:MAG: porin [Dysgonomonas sp.]